MRLVCPNCSAQYEIDVSMIPDEGRDVQCSNCGHTWFELPAPPEMMEAESAMAAEAAADPLSTEIQAEVEVEVESEASSEVETTQVETDGLDEDLEEASESSADETPAFDDTPTARELEAEEEEVFGATTPKARPAATKEALDILREEAAEEIEKRRAPPSVPIETQTDMGLEALSQRTPSRALRARMARLDEEATEEKPEKGGRWRNRFGKGKAAEEPISDETDFAEENQSNDDGYNEPRRDLLPDIEEINSTLASTKTRDEPSPEVVAEQQRSFRQGFVIPVATAAILIVLYAYAPAIARQVPATETALLQYVDAANGARDAIQGLLGR